MSPFGFAFYLVTFKDKFPYWPRKSLESFSDNIVSFANWTYFRNIICFSVFITSSSAGKEISVNQPIFLLSIQQSVLTCIRDLLVLWLLPTYIGPGVLTSISECWTPYWDDINLPCPKIGSRGPNFWPVFSGIARGGLGVTIAQGPGATL